MATCGRVVPPASLARATDLSGDTDDTDPACHDIAQIRRAARVAPSAKAILPAPDQPALRLQELRYRDREVAMNQRAVFSARAIAVALLTAAAALCSAPAQAQPARVFVSAQGLDSNSCTFASPCRTFQHAHDVVAPGGEIDVLDPAGYGNVIINKAISIQAHGFAGVTVGSGETAITINANPNDAVNLTGLLIEGAGVGTNGI